MDEMNDQERQRIDTLERNIDTFIASHQAFTSSLDAHFKRRHDIYYAIKGNEFDAQSGLARQIGTIRTQMTELELRVEKNEQSNYRILAFSSAIAVVISVLFNVGKLLITVWTK